MGHQYTSSLCLSVPPSLSLSDVVSPIEHWLFSLLPGFPERRPWTNIVKDTNIWSLIYHHIPISCGRLKFQVLETYVLCSSITCPSYLMIMSLRGLVPPSFFLVLSELTWRPMKVYGYDPPPIRGEACWGYCSQVFLFNHQAAEKWWHSHKQKNVIDAFLHHKNQHNLDMGHNPPWWTILINLILVLSKECFFYPIIPFPHSPLSTRKFDQITLKSHGSSHILTIQVHIFGSPAKELVMAQQSGLGSRGN